MCVIDVPKNDVALLDFFKKTLYEEIVPFWLKYAVDKQYGGLQTCIAGNGVIVSTDKFVNWCSDYNCKCTTSFFLKTR